MSTDITPVIVGAGLAGLLAAHAWPAARIAEAAPAPVETHKALLRFRSQAVSHLTGVEFSRVRVRKGIWFEGAEAAPSVRMANLYARKVLGAAGLGDGERSVWNLEPVDRYIAPDDFYERLVERVYARVMWGVGFDYKDVARASGPLTPVVSTAPLPAVLQALNMPAGELEFRRSPITVERYAIPGARLYQTLYFPGAETPVYRASMTGSTLIIEYAGDVAESWQIGDVIGVLEAFGLDGAELINIGTVQQKYGKILDVEAGPRKNLLFQMTQRYGVYSLGRFATWRNVLLDDVVDDIAVIKRFISSGGAQYDLHRAAGK